MVFMLKRRIECQIGDYLKSTSHKILFVWGPRRSGKTTILKEVSREKNLPIFNFDFISDREKFPAKRGELEKLAKEHKVILIDEVQNFPEATISLKLLHDEFKVKVIATGSSELRAKSKTFDSLANRFNEIYCLPFSTAESLKNAQPKAYEEKDFFRENLEQTQIFGSYPEVVLAKTENEKIDLLQNLLDTYVLKDIIEIYDLKNMKLAKDILTKIALQLGSEVSLRELSSSLGANVATVSNYVEIFIKNYILIPLPSFKTNARRAVSENRKLYFFDLGLRNILVRDFRETSLRPDAGGVFESFVVSETEKAKRNHHLKFTAYFYREYGGREIDLVFENYKKEYICVEIKKKKGGIKNIFPRPAKVKIVTRENYGDFLHSLCKGM